MIRKIILENYMSHIHTVIEPAAGLTVLSGPNNCGKSAIAHALEMICYNSDAAGFAIRHGAKKATVTIETQDEDGTVHTLVWERKKDTCKYIVDGREISGMGKGNVPDDLHKYLKMPEVDKKDPFRINFGLQKKPIFLLDEPKSRAAQFFASSSDAERLMEMQRRHKQKEANAKRDKDRLDAEIGRLDQQLVELLPLDRIADRLGKLEADETAIRAMQEQIIALARTHTAIEQATSVAGTNRARLGVLSNLKSTPLLRETIGLARLVKELAAGTHRLDRESMRMRATEKLQHAPQMGDVKTLRNICLRMQQLATDAIAQQQRRVVLSKAQPPPTLADAGPMRQKINAMIHVEKKLEAVQARHRLLAVLAPLPEQRDRKPLADLLARLEALQTSASTAQKALHRAEKNLRDLAKQIETYVQENPRCESCGQSISAALVMSGGHAHG